LLDVALIGIATKAAFKWLGEKGVGALGARLKQLLSDRAAKAELTDITRAAIEEAVAIAPQLSDGLLSQGYLTDILKPALLVTLADPTGGLSAAEFSDQFVSRYIQPYLGDRPLDGALSQFYDLDREQLETVFAKLKAALTSRLYRSKHWRDAVHDISTEEIRSGVSELIAAQRAAKQDGADMRQEVEAAREDAHVGSDHLRSWPQLIRGLHIDRPELETLLHRIRQEPSAATLLVGPAGSGKSALLAQLTERLEHDGMAVFALKADKLPSDVVNLTDVSQALGLSGDIGREVDVLSKSGPVVLIIDQLDAVSEVMDTTSQRMRVLLQLANRWRVKRPQSEPGPPVHVIVSSRPFEARHDARFETIGAHEVTLSLPAYDRVEALLSQISVDPATVPAHLRETVRRPFMLKLYVDLALKGEALGSLSEADLLNAWLAAAQFGGPTERADVLKLLTVLAAEMMETESLWRPADKFDIEMPGAVTRAEACDLLLRQDGRLGFSHQAWLDDFQARRFVTGQQLADHAWATQDGLFSRSTILRGLERFRRADTAAYDRALDLLLGDARTRRHLRHLVVDLVAIQTQPLPREIGWVERLIREDSVLATRAITRIVENWTFWRIALAQLIPVAASNPATVWGAVAMSTAEAKFDPEEGERLIGTLWADETSDRQAFEIGWRSGLWSPGIRSRIKAMFERGDPKDLPISMYATQLVDCGRPESAAELLGLYLPVRPYTRYDRREFHGMEKMADAAPVAFVNAVLPWFIQIATGGDRPNSTIRDNYPISYNLPLDWQEEDDHSGGVFSCLVRSMQAMAESDAPAFLKLAASVDAIESDEVQALVADAFAAAGAKLAQQGFDWLIADPRRFLVGSAHMQGEDSVWRRVDGWSSRELVRSIVPHLTDGQVTELAAAIEAWNPYTEAARDEANAKDRRRMRDYAESYRMPLLDLLPPAALTSRRRRQVIEARATEPAYKARRGRMMASYVPSPMSDAQMSRASDDDLFRMLDEVNDVSNSGDSRRPFMIGGVHQLAQAFAGFGRANRQRAIKLVRERFQPGRHELAASALILDLGQQADVDAQELRDLIRFLAARGFASDDFHRNAAWALENIAGRLSGLDDDDIRLIASWLSTDEQHMAEQETRRREARVRNKENNKSNETSSARPLLFGHSLGGLNVLPAGNYPILSAIGSGLLRRDPPDYQAWLAILEHHVDQVEEADVWSAILYRHGWALHWVERERAAAFARKLFERRPEVFEASLTHFLWTSRAFIPQDVQLAALEKWLGSEAVEDRQLAGEFAFACWLVDPDGSPEIARRADLLVSRLGDPAQLGAVFAAAAAWRESNLVLRQRAHEVLLSIGPEASGDVAAAVSSALDQYRTLPADELTKALLTTARDNPALLKACLNGRFEDALQQLLNHPGFEDLVLEIAERGADLMLGDRNGRGGHVNHDLVPISIALQRNVGTMRVRAMDLYEKLLDADVYGADQAARASLRR
jgi:hypothetical protein